ncbi:hypothetical protein [Variovorax soli]|uniref:Uncharacterized protein n=1 Tax=Variovorax soli TaxID=376815 RepID=A0ABU1NKP3_9BURK|nr:hypothetical protein [Variovorax soli]MDR6539014.1 hypothetical protein [Variovorax soli]
MGQRVLCHDEHFEGARQLNEANHPIAGLLVDYLDGRVRGQSELFLLSLTDEQARIQSMQAWYGAKYRIGG